MTSENTFVSVSPGDYESRQVYKLMTGIIVPRPVALVSTVDRNSVANVAPFSFFNGVGSVPPTVLFCTVLRRDTGKLPVRKDSLTSKLQ